MKHQRGIIQIIAVLIIIVVIAALLGVNAEAVWDVLSKIILFIWGIVVIIAEWLVGLLKNAGGAIDWLRGLF